MKRRPIIVSTAATLLVIGCAAGWWAWNRWMSPSANPSKEIYPIRGIDISAHNGEIDFSRLANQGIDFAYIKATEGTDFIDRRFAENATALHRHGIAAGAYHFFRFDTDGELQAWNFIRALQGRNFLLPPAIDLEEWTNDPSISTHRVRTTLKALLAVMRDEGYTPLIYTNRDGYTRFVKGHLDEYPLWIASFTSSPLPANEAFHIWQYTHRGRLEGISGHTDLNAMTREAWFSLTNSRRE